MNKNDVEVPSLIKDNCRQLRGYYVPFVIYKDDFKINDGRKLEECLRFNKCSICGQEMEEGKRWFVAGPGSLFHRDGAIIDLAVHYKCGRYALQVCPYLVYNSYNKKLDIEKLQKKHSDLILVDPTVELDRVPLFGLVNTEMSYRNGRGRIVLERPYKRVEFWKDGVRLPFKEGLVIVREYLKEKYNVDPVY